MASASPLVPALALLLAAAFVAPPPALAVQPDARSMGSVGATTLDRVTIDDGSFRKGGKEFHFIGFNQYYMLDKARRPSERHIVDETLKDAAELGMTVMRTWAFDDRPTGLQVLPGVFDEDTFRALDYVLDSSARHGIHVILALVNYWPDYGGMESYVKWCTHSTTVANRSVSEFYENPACRQMYKNTVQTVMTRRNTYNGRVYNEDPTILGWDLANEPRNPGDPSSNVLARWIREMSHFAKLVSPRQLITTGVEGFFGLTTPNLALNANPGRDEWDSWICEGTDFVRFHSLPHVDFTVAHMYPDLWVDRPCNGSYYCKELFASRWVDTHIEQSVMLGKPFVLEEFGSTANTSSAGTRSYARDMKHREDVFETVFTEMEEAASRSEIRVGSLFWSFSSLKYPDYDGFSVYAPPRESKTSEEPQTVDGGAGGREFDWGIASWSTAVGGNPVLFSPAPREDPLDYIWVMPDTPEMQNEFRNARKHRQCARYLRKSVRDGLITSSFREKPQAGDSLGSNLVPFREVETSHDDTINIISNAARKFDRLSQREAFEG